jgi:hypothetical protein
MDAKYSKEVGSGRIVPDTPVPVGTRGSWDIVFMVGRLGIAVGGAVIIGSPQYWSPAVLRREGAPADGFPEKGVPAASISGPEDAALEAEQHGPHWIKVSPRARGLRPGEEIVLHYQGVTTYVATGTIDAPELNGFPISVDADGRGELVYVDPWPRLTILPSPRKLIHLTTASQVAAGESLRCTAAILDEHANLTPDYSGHLRLYLDRKSGQPIASYKFKPEDRGCHTFEGLPAPAPGLHFLVAATDDGLEEKSNQFEVTARPPEFRVFWGDIHGKSRFSDGYSTPDSYYRYARDVSGFDFCAISDHDWAGNMYIEPYKRVSGVATEGWEVIKQKAKEYHVPGRFVTFLGYEWTLSGGHRNVYYRGDEGDVYGCQSPESSHARQLDAIIEARGDAIIIPHHPLASLSYCRDNPRLQPVCEMYSSWGLSEERENEFWTRPIHVQFMSYQELLARGMKIGTVAGSDDHLGIPGRPTRHHRQSGVEGHARYGLMAIWAKELTREALWEALLARRTYGTTGVRLLLEFTINGRMMGEEIRAADRLEIRARAAGTAPIVSLELLRCNEVIHRVPGEGDKASLELEDRVKRENGTAWYYVRVRQEDKMMAWSSPIWVSPE